MWVYDSTSKTLLRDYARFNKIAEELETAGLQDLLRQGMRREDVKHRIEVDMRYGNQLVQTTVILPVARLKRMDDVMALIKQFSVDYGNRFGKGSEAPEAGIRINTIRVQSFVELETVQFKSLATTASQKKALPTPLEMRKCYFVDHKEALDTKVFGVEQLENGHVVEAPAVIISPVTTYLVEPGWVLEIGEHGAAWFTRAANAQMDTLKTAGQASRNKVMA